MKIVFESTPTLTGRVLEGTALTPAVSLNGNIYSADSIDNAKNIGVPLVLDWEHTDEKIGSVIFSLNPSNHSLSYKATVTSETRAAQIAQSPEKYKVSIEANVDDVTESCGKTKCYNLVEGLTMSGMAVTATPSVQTTSLRVVESLKPLQEFDFGELARVNQEIEMLKSRIEKLEAFLTTGNPTPPQSDVCPDCGELII